MPPSNPFARIADRYASLPERLRRPLVTRAIGETIPFVETAGCFVDTYTSSRVTIQLENKTSVQNHLGGLHAAALALLTETASGLVVALNVPPESTPILRTMDISYDRFAREQVMAEARLSDEKRTHIQSSQIGRVDVNVTVSVPEAEDPLVQSQLTWAWLPENRL